MRRALLSWTLVFALLAAGFGAAVLALNADLYSAGGFVRSYLAALQRHDSAGALAFEGVQGASGLVTDATVGGFDDARVISDVADGDMHTVRAGYTIAGDELVTEFVVERTGTRLGLFATWRFAASPIATLAARVDHDTRLSVNGVNAASGDYAMLVPASVTLEHETTYLEALPLHAQLTEVASTVDALLEVAPTPAFADAATAAIVLFLDGCATQQVLKPTGCPFGTDVANRLDSPPAWTMAEYPTAALSADGTAWHSSGDGVAHVSASVKSLFDGSVSQLERDVSFSATYVVAIGSDDSLSVSIG